MSKDSSSMVQSQIARRGVTNQRVLEAMERVPRHQFVPQGHAEYAYADQPLPIGYGQTISQPYVVALMTEKLQLDSSDRVLEIGTGSGYQAALLAELVGEVVTLEIVEPLARRAKALFRDLGYRNITAQYGDGYYGWPELAPYDAIIVTAGAPEMPPPLIEQLKTGGHMVIPVDASTEAQQLLLVTKEAHGKLRTEELLPVRFVPLTGERPQKH